MLSEPLLRRLPASAGSGKTFKLVSLFLQALSGSEHERRVGCLLEGAADSASYAWSEILAVTFTNSAAIEMRERILERLKHLALQDGMTFDSEDAPFTASEAAIWLEILLQRSHVLNVRTIDSLVQAIVRLSALDLHIVPDFEPVFELSEALDPLLDVFFEDARKTLETQETNAYETFLREACYQNLLHSHDFKGFLSKNHIRKRVIELVPLFLQSEGLSLTNAEALSAYREKRYADVHNAATAMFKALENIEEGINKNFLNALNKCLNLRPPNELTASAMLAKAGIEECITKKSKHLVHDEHENAYQNLCDVVKRFQECFVLIKNGLRMAPYAELARLVALALPEVLKTEGRIPQILMNRLAQEALQGQFGLAQFFCRFGNPLTHILIDEFQDTNREQWTILHALSLEALAHGGSLTWVGDVKQAIYGWRGGDATLFEQVAEDHALLQLASRKDLPPLQNNRRSARAIVEFNNAVFSQLGNIKTAHNVLSVLLGSTASQSVLEKHSHILMQSFANTKQQALREGGSVTLDYLEANTVEALDEQVHELLVARVSDILQEHSAGDVAILVRDNKHAALAADWLLQAGFPVVTENSFLLAQHPLIVQLVAMLQFQNNPHDDLALWTIFGGGRLIPEYWTLQRVQLTDWLAARQLTKNKNESLYCIIQEAFPDLWEWYFAPFYAESGLLTPYDATQEILQHFAVWERYPEDAVFIRRFLEVLYHAETEGKRDLTSFLNFWEKEGHKEKAPMPSGLNAIRILTVHKAKGLQFPVVVMPWCAPKIKAREEAQVINLESEIQLVSPPCPGTIEYAHVKAENVREELHLLYVAWTRPEEALHVFLTSTSKTQTGTEAIRVLLDNIGSGIAFFGNEAHKKQVRLKTEWSEVSSLHSERVNIAGQSLQLQQSEIGNKEPWRPMYWLPQLKIFRNPLGELTERSALRGTLVHACLEALTITGHPEHDARLAVIRGLQHTRSADKVTPFLRASFENMLAWFAALPEAKRWLQEGYREQNMLDAQGTLYRVDLLVNEKNRMLVLDYKTGQKRKTHQRSLQGYMSLLCNVQTLPVIGVLIYLDLQEIEWVTS